MTEVNEIPIVSIAAINESDVGLNQNIFENQEVILFGVVEDEDNDLDGSTSTTVDDVNYLWVCTQDGNPITVTNETSINASFTSPSISTNLETKMVICTLQATDPFQVINGTSSTSESINITIYNDNQPPTIDISAALTPSMNEDSSWIITLSELDLSNFISVTDVDNDEIFTLEIDIGENYSLDNLTITPDSDFYGEISIPIRVDDGIMFEGELYNNLSETAYLSIDVIGVNDPPILVGPDNSAAEEDTDIGITGVSVSDADIDGIIYDDRLQYNFSTENGTISLNQTLGLIFEDGCDCDGINDTILFFTSNPQNFNNAVSTLTFHPTLNYFGPDGEITISVNDEGNIGIPDGLDPTELTDLHTISISVNAINDPPIFTVPVSTNLDEDSQVLVTSFSVDDVDIEDYTMEVELSIEHGVISLAVTAGITFDYGDGVEDEQVSFSGTKTAVNNLLNSITFIPDEHFNGDVILSAEVNDLGAYGSGGSLTDNQTFTITVNAINDAPEGVDDNFSIVEDTALAENILINDIDLDEINGSSPSSHYSLSINTTAIENVQHGSLSLSADGSFTYQPFANYNGNDSFVYEVIDGEGLTAQAIVNIVISPVNNAPEFNNFPSSQIAYEDYEKEIEGISVADVDIAENDMEMQLSVDNGVITLGSITGLTFSLGDGDSDASLIFSGTITDISSAIDPLTFRPNEHFNGDVQLQVEANDLGGTGAGGPLAVAGNLLITVNAVNDNPTATDDTGTTDEDIIFTSNVMSNDSDLDSSSGSSPDNHFSLTVRSVPIIDVQNGILTLSSDGVFSYEPYDDYFGTDSFVYELIDGEGLADSATVFIMVNGVNDAPELELPTDKYTDEDTPISIDGIIFTDIDIAESEMKMDINADNSFISLATIDGLTFISGDGVSDSQLSFTGNKTSILNATSTIVFTPEENYNGVVTVEVSISDIGGNGSGGILADTAEFLVTIASINDGPEISSPGAQSDDEDNEFSIYGLSVSDIDGIESTNEVQITISSDNGKLSLYPDSVSDLIFSTGDGTLDSEIIFSGIIPDVNAALNGFSFLGNSHYNGEDTITVQISDLGNTGAGDILEQEIKMGIYLNAVNDPPVNQLINGEDAPPQISVLGTEITATTGSWNDNIDTFGLTSSNIIFAYQWQRNSVNCTNGLYDNTCNDDDGNFLEGNLCGESSECQLEDDNWLDIIEENLETYEIENIDAQKYIRVEVTATDDGVGLPSQQSTIAFSGFHYVDNSAPVPQNIGYNIYEDNILTEDAPGILVNDSDPDGDVIEAEVVTYPENGEVNLSPNGSFVYTPNPNFNGVDQFEYTVNDGALYGNDNAFVSITIISVNDIPVFTSGGDVESSENSGMVERFGWASDISDGDPEVTQALEFTLIASDSTQFEVQPTVDPVSGTLRFAVFDNLNENVDAWDSVVTIVLNDSSGDEYGGIEETDSIQFNINIIPINDSPSFTAGDVITVLEDSGEYSQFSWATDIDDGDDELVQGLSFSIVSNDNSLLFIDDGLPAVDESGNISFTPADNYNGVAQLVIALVDSGSGIDPNSNTSLEQPLIINVTPVNDIPQWTVGERIEILEDAGPQTNVGYVTEIDDGDPEVTQELTFTLIDVSNESLFAVTPVIDNIGTLTYLINEDANGSSFVYFKLKDDGGTDNGGVDLTSQQVFEIEVSAVNDSPIFVLGTLAQQINIIDVDEDLYTEIGIEVSSIDIPTDEVGQTITYSLDSYEAFDASGDAFAILSIEENEGTISIYPIENGHGSDIITVTAHDSSGVEYGGIEEYQQTFTIIVNPLNDPPEFNLKAPPSLGGGLITNEEGIELDEDFTSRTYSMDLLPAPENESTQNVLFSCNCDSIDFADISINSITGYVTFQNITDDNGSIDLRITATDDGSINNEGDVNSYTQFYPLIINAVNDVPSFIKGDDQFILEDEGENSISWATDISRGPANEISQGLSFLVITDNDAFFKDSQIPIIEIDGTSGNLIYQIADDLNGDVNVSLTLKDDGETAFDGVDESEPQTFNISVQAVNDPPDFSLGSNDDLEINEDEIGKSLENWISDIIKGPDDEIADVLTFHITSSKSDSTIFSVFPQIDEESGTIEYSINPEYNGKAQFTINLSDDGGIENGGDSISVDKAFSIWVHQINDIPKPFEVYSRVFDYAKDTTTFYFDVDVSNDTTDIFYRLPYQVFAPPMQPDSLLRFYWEKNDSLDVDTYATWNLDSKFELYYRLEGTPSDSSKTFVLSDDIDRQLLMDVDSIFVDIDMTAEFPVYTGDFNHDYMPAQSDDPLNTYISEYLDTTGVTQYSWTVVAQNYSAYASVYPAIDSLYNDPVRTSLSDVDLKIDLELPSAEMAFFQSELYSEYYDLYFITNEETIDSVARVWVDFDTYTQNLFPSKMDDSLYHISSTFVSTGTVKYNFQVRDKRLNLGRSLDTVKYEILIPELARTVSSPDNVLEMYVPENAVAYETPVIISVSNVDGDLSKNSIEIISREYQITANSMVLLKSAILSFTLSENFTEESSYKYKIIKINDNSIEELSTEFDGESFVSSIMSSGNYAVAYNSTAIEPLPEKFALGNIYPNPFNPSTTIEFDIPDENNVMIDIYNLRGQHVLNLKDENINPGYHAVVWSGLDNTGRIVPSGIYFVNIKFANQLMSKKVTFLK
jgi:hypothetical protein